MAKVWMYGASDDLIEIRGDVANASLDEVPVRDKADFTARTAKGSGRMAIRWRYGGKNGSWSVEVAPVDEDLLPELSCRVLFGDAASAALPGDERCSPYSALLEIEMDGEAPIDLRLKKRAR